MGMTYTGSQPATQRDDAAVEFENNTQRILEFLSTEEKLEIPGVVNQPAPELDFDIVTPPVFERIPSPNEVKMLDFLRQQS